MGYHVKIEELLEVQNQMISQLSEWGTQLEAVYQALETIVATPCIQGETGKSIQNYIQEVHIPVIGSLQQLLTEFQVRLSVYAEGYYGIDSSYEAEIPQEIFEEQQQVLENGREDFENLREEINSVISSVSDIVSVVQPSGLALVLSYQLMESRVKTLNSDIGDYEETHQNDTQNMNSMLESIRSILIARTGSPAISVTNYQAGSIAMLPSYQRLQMGYEASGNFVAQNIAQYEAAMKKNEDRIEGIVPNQDVNYLKNVYDSKMWETMNAHYGFTKQQSVLITKVFRNLERQTGLKMETQEKIHYIFSVLAPLCINYNAKRFQITAGTLSLEKAIKELEKSGLSEQEILDFRVLVNLQHGASEQDILDAGIKFEDSIYSDINADTFRYNSSTITKDFAHELIQYSAFSYEPNNLLDEAMKEIVDLANSKHGRIYTKYEISFKGDIDSTRWGWNFNNGLEIDDSKVDWGDFASDVDAINIYERMIKCDDSDSVLDIINEYNCGLLSGETKRQTEFLSNLGSGNIGDGIIKLDEILKVDTIASEFIKDGSDPIIEKKIQKGKETFVQWIMENYQLEQEKCISE